MNGTAYIGPSSSGRRPRHPRPPATVVRNLSQLGHHRQLNISTVVPPGWQVPAPPRLCAAGSGSIPWAHHQAELNLWLYVYACVRVYTYVPVCICVCVHVCAFLCRTGDDTVPDETIIEVAADSIWLHQLVALIITTTPSSPLTGYESGEHLRFVLHSCRYVTAGLVHPRATKILLVQQL